MPATLSFHLNNKYSRLKPEFGTILTKNLFEKLFADKGQSDRLRNYPNILPLSTFESYYQNEAKQQIEYN